MKPVNVGNLKQRILIKLFFNDGGNDLCIKLFTLIRPSDVENHIIKFLTSHVHFDSSFRVSYSLGQWASDRDGNKSEVLN